MGENTKIAWATSTFNPWVGCTKVSPGCANCYAETWDQRWGGDHWGVGKARRRTSAANWRKPLAWDTAAAKAGTTPRVFCGSLCDWLDPEVPSAWLADLLTLIVSTPNLRWLMLTKRPELWRARLNRAYAYEREVTGGYEIEAWLLGTPLPNVWIGATVEDQRRADERIAHLLSIPAEGRFVSCEPLLDWVSLPYAAFPATSDIMSFGGVDWVIAGCESGPGRRPCKTDWFRSLRDQCVAAGVPFMLKQMEVAGRVEQHCPPLDGEVWAEVPR